MKKPIRIAMIMGKMLGGGVEAVVLNYYRHIDKEKFQFDFIIDKNSSVVPDEEIIGLGGRIYLVDSYSNLKQFNKDLKQLFIENNYKIVHSHINTLSVFPLRIAKNCGIPIRIAHNHSVTAPGEYKRNTLKYLLKIFSKVYPTHYLAPTMRTARWLFWGNIKKNNLLILNNAIDTKKFRYNPIIRKNIRDKFELNDTDIVIGNIGRLVSSKKQLLLLDILYELNKKSKIYKLIIVGDGPMKHKLEQKIENLGMEHEVFLLESTNNIERIYQGMDLFLFPSSSEGLGMVAIEAQISGLAVIASSLVPPEIKITRNCSFVSLKSSVSFWKKEVEYQSNIKIDRDENYKIAQKSEYNIEIEVHTLEKFYTLILSK